MATPLIMLGLLVGPYVVLAAVPGMRWRRSLRGRIGLALVFVFTGVGHFVTPEQMAEMIPPVVPWRVELIYVSGVIEIAAAVAVLVERTRRAAGWFIIAMLVGLLPFNIYAAIVRAPMGGHAWGPAYLLVRVPLQLVLLAWCYWFAVRMRDEAGDASDSALSG